MPHSTESPNFCNKSAGHAVSCPILPAVTKFLPMHLPNSNPLSCLGHMLSPVPAGVLPCSPVNSPDFCYLNHDHTPLPNPLKRHLNIKQHNEVWFSDPPPSVPPSYPARTTQPAVLLDLPDTSPFPSLASMDALPPPTASPALAPTPAPDPAALALALASSADKSFSISCLPSGAAPTSCWHLVCFDSALTASDPDCSDSVTSGVCHVQFRLQHPSNKSLSHPRSRWWSQWNRCSINPVDNIMEFGAIQLISPARTPDPTKFVAWSTALPLSNLACHLLGPFDFQARFMHPTVAALLPLPIGIVCSPSAKPAASFLLPSLLLLSPVGSPLALPRNKLAPLLDFLSFHHLAFRSFPSHSLQGSPLLFFHSIPFVIR
jgi:hypothetical protein